MPAFTFEKIAPPAPLGAEPSREAPKDDSKRTGMLNRMLDRLLETRFKGLVPPPSPHSHGEDLRRD